tara:strand:- start:30 stop:878 length:849 start_codon:yes stop_codon:yes gene_type:complete
MANNLGKGLGALIKSYSTENKEQYLNDGIDIKDIIPNKNQPRYVFESKKMQSLVESIKNKGILQPLSIRKIKNNKFELIAGERRYRAAIEAGLKTVPAYIINIKNEVEMMEYALIENIQRVDLNPIEEAEGYAILSGKYHLTHELIAQSVSKSRTEVSNKLRLLKLPPIIKKALSNNEIEYGHSRALLGIKESTVMIRIFKQVIQKKLNVRQTESLIKNLHIKQKRKTKTDNQLDYSKYELELQSYLDSKTIIKNNGQKAGRVIINFSSKNELQKIIKKIKK